MSLEATQGRFEVEKFDGKGDYGLWKHMLLMALEIQGLEDVMEESDKNKESKEKLDETWLKRDKRARNLICTSLVPKVLRKVLKEKTALGVLSALDRDYQNKSLPNRIYLKQKFASFKMDVQKDMEENVDNFLKLVADLASLDIDISDEDQAIQILSSLPRGYESLKDALKYGNKSRTLTLDDVVNAAYSKEIDLKEKETQNNTYNAGEGLYVQAKGKPKINKAGTTCFYCGKLGHWKRECPDRQRKDESANIVTEPQQPLVLTISNENTSEWVMDSGCTFHITADRDVLFDLEELEGGKVLMANNTHSEVKGIGKIRITNPDGSVVVLTGVRYMPDISRNLISYGMLEKAGCRYSGKDFKVTFTKDGRNVLSGKYKDGLYFLEGTVGNGEINLVKGKTEPRATKGYRVWIPKEGKCTTSRNVVFSEEEVFKTIMNQKLNNDEDFKNQSTFFSGEGAGETSNGQDMEPATEPAIEPENEPTLSESSSSKEEELEVSDLSNYILARDRKRRQNVKKPLKYEEGNLVAYALAVAEDLEITEPKSFQDAITSKENKQWRATADEEVDSLYRNHTWDAAKCALQYLKGEMTKGIVFQKDMEDYKIKGLCNSDYATDLDGRHSVTGYIFKVWGNIVSWKSCLQSVVALWLKGLCEKLGLKEESGMIRDIIAEGGVQLSKVHTNSNAAEFLTKALPGPKFNLCCDLVNLGC